MLDAVITASLHSSLDSHGGEMVPATVSRTPTSLYSAWQPWVVCFTHNTTHLLLLGSRYINYFTDEKIPESLSNLPKTLTCGPETAHEMNLGSKRNSVNINQTGWLREKAGQVMRTWLETPVREVWR